MTTYLSCHSDISLNIVQLASDKNDFTIENNYNYNIYYFPKNKLNKNYENYYRYYRNIWFILRQYIKSSEKDRLIFHLNFNHEYSLLSIMKRDFPMCQTIFTIHYQDWFHSLNGNYLRFKNIIEKGEDKLTLLEKKSIYKSYKKEKTLYMDVDAIICLCNFTKNILTKNYDIPNDKIKVINNGISDEAVILSSTKRKQLRQKLFIPEDEIIILFVGRLEEIKGVDALIEAFILIVKDYPDCHLYIIGDGDLNDYMRKAEGYWRKITFTGRLKKEEVYMFYQVADVGILPSRYESFGYVAIEMMMFDIPIIATKTSGLNEIIIDKVNGYKVPITETENKVIVPSEIIKDCFIKIIKSPSGRKKISRNIFLQNYTTQKMTERYIPLLYKIHNNGKDN